MWYCRHRHHPCSGLPQSNAAKRKNANLQAELRDCTERVGALAAAMKRRDKAQGAKDKSTALSRSVEIKRLQVFFRVRMTREEESVTDRVNGRENRVRRRRKYVLTSFFDYVKHCCTAVPEAYFL